MTLNDLFKRVDIKKDKDKMIIWSDGIGWDNIEIEIGENCIKVLPSKGNSPFYSDN